MATAITGRAAEGGRTSKMAGLESAEVTGMPATRADISDIRHLVCLGPSSILAVDTGVAVMTCQDSGVAPVA